MSLDPSQNPLPPIVVPSQALSPGEVPSETATSNPYATPGSFGPQLTPVDIKQPGPGILISFSWLLGLIAAQVSFAVAAFIVIAIVSAMSGTQVDFNDTEGLDNVFKSDWAALVLLASSQFATMFVALAAAFLHARHNFVERLELRLPRPHHWAMGLLAVIPMSIIATETALIVGQVDGVSLKYLQESLDNMNTVPFAGILLFGCVFPGVFEELLFRGVLGKGMTGRLGPSLIGIATGVGFASLYFGLAHIIPAHAASAAVMGIFLHLAFLYSRSFWVPVLMHVVNNAMAFTLSRYENIMPIPGYTSDLGGDAAAHISPQLLAAGFFATLALVICWRHFRATAPDGTKGGGATPTSSTGLGWLLLIGLLVTQTILAVVLVNSVEKM